MKLLYKRPILITFATTKERTFIVSQVDEKLWRAASVLSTNHLPRLNILLNKFRQAIKFSAKYGKKTKTMLYRF